MKFVITNTLSFLVMMAVNSLANILPINGKTTRQLSDQYPNLFVPAGVTFSIWAVIYLLLLIIIVLQFFPRYGGRTIKVGWLISINFLLNSAWIVAWHYERVIMSLMIMISLLTTLVLINVKLRQARGWLLQVAFGVYLGWICLATIANITALLVAFSWSGFGMSEQTWAVAMVIVGALVGALVIYNLGNPFVTLALIWGFYGIVLKREIDYPSIARASFLGMTIVVATALWVVLKGKYRSHPVMEKMR